MTTENTNVARVERHEIDHAPEPQQQGGGILSVIERIASNPEIDVERMQALLQMRADEEDRIRRMDREDRADAAKRAWLRDFSKVQAELEPIRRNRENEQTRSRYADLAAIDRALTPILTRHGFSTSYKRIPAETDGNIRMRLHLGHAEGHIEQYEDEYPLDKTGAKGNVNKTDIHAQGSAESYARRYIKLNAVDIATHSDNDGNAPRNSGEIISADQFTAIVDLMEQAEADEGKFLSFFKLDHLGEMPMSRYGEADAILRKKLAAKERIDA